MMSPTTSLKIWPRYRGVARRAAGYWRFAAGSGAALRHRQ
jgi:hypothetical protein